MVQCCSQIFNYANVRAEDVRLIANESNQKSNLHYTRGITPKRVTSGGAHLRGLAPGLQLRRNVTAVASRWRHCADLTGPGIEPQTSRTESVRLATELTAGHC